ncbi:hypothetical protein FDUTEX481_02070 [Tolypothrix sp. PCC 7601]|nr:hypothetical protein FDUTEX481_02070 [Tolypothrix sp. PCC 7601]
MVIGDHLAMFQSPYGGSVSGNLEPIKRKSLMECFNPLAGEVLAETVWVSVGHGRNEMFQSPCGGSVSGNPAILKP